MRERTGSAIASASRCMPPSGSSALPGGEAGQRPQKPAGIDLQGLVEEHPAEERPQKAFDEPVAESGLGDDVGRESVPRNGTEPDRRTTIGTGSRRADRGAAPIRIRPVATPNAVNASDRRRGFGVDRPTMAPGDERPSWNQRTRTRSSSAV